MKASANDQSAFREAWPRVAESCLCDGGGGKPSAGQPEYRVLDVAPRVPSGLRRARLGESEGTSRPAARARRFAKRRQLQRTVLPRPCCAASRPANEEAGCQKEPPKENRPLILARPRGFEPLGFGFVDLFLHTVQAGVRTTDSKDSGDLRQKRRPQGATELPRNRHGSRQDSVKIRSR